MDSWKKRYFCSFVHTIGEIVLFYCESHEETPICLPLHFVALAAHHGDERLLLDSLADPAAEFIVKVLDLRAASLARIAFVVDELLQRVAVRVERARLLQESARRRSEAARLLPHQAPFDTPREDGRKLVGLFEPFLQVHVADARQVLHEWRDHKPPKKAVICGVMHGWQIV